MVCCQPAEAGPHGVGEERVEAHAGGLGVRRWRVGHDQVPMMAAMMVAGNTHAETRLRQ